MGSGVRAFVPHLRQLNVSPTSSDLAIATALAHEIAVAGRGRVRRVTMIGSRAAGVARPNSDLDLVVLVEVAKGSPAWGPAENLAERDRIQRAVGVPPITTDLLVRTTDQYHEAREVIGGPEHLIDVEGHDVYSQPLEHPPTIRRGVAQVRRQHAGTWITHAAAVLDEATSSAAAIDWVSVSHSSAMRSVTALLVTHQLHNSKHDGIHRMLQQLSQADPAAAAELRATLEKRDPPFQKANAVLRLAAARLASDPGMAPYLQRAQAWLRKAQTVRTP